MPLFAVTAMEKLKTMPPDFWLKVGIGVVAVIVAIFVFRRVMKMNKIIASIIVFVVVSIVFFSWVYNRNEPKFLTPLVERIAPFFPSAGSYAAKQQTAPKP
jgi:glucan phosphoethanolaminetransferase (alkaline phosphatase superfamily)